MICIPLKAKNFKKLMKDFHISQKSGDLVEIWFDEIPEKDLTEKNLEKIFSLKKKPIIYKTTLPAEQAGAVLTRKGLIKYIKKIDYMDMDIKTPDHLIKTIKKLSPKSKIIISYHNFKSTPKDSELAKIAKKCLEKDADIVKIATFAKTVSDSIRILKFLERQTRLRFPLICLCMGEKGRITRLAGHLFGNYLMYAPLELKKKTAEGQMDIKELTNFQNLIK